MLPAQRACGMVRLMSIRHSAVNRLAVRYASTKEPPFLAQIKSDLKTAMRAGDALAKTTLREVMSEIKNANIAKAGSVESDVNVHALLDQLASKREKSIEQYEAGGRGDLAEGERKELEFLRGLQAKIPVATAEQIETRITELLNKLKEAGENTPTLKSVTQNLVWSDVERDWQASRKSVIHAARKVLGMGGDQKRSFSTHIGGLRSHSNPLGLPRRSPSTVGDRAKPDCVPRPIPNVKNVILISSAKGGVGKSTVAVNLALALRDAQVSGTADAISANQPARAVGVLDVDIFGPSLPTMLGVNGEPRLTPQGKLVPLQAYGLKAMSMGFLIPPDRAVAWRGLLVQKALQQLLFDVDWGELNCLVVDMPPGTGDVQLTIAQMLAVDGVVIVSTPQDVALIDARRGIDMFRVTKTPILGIVQNMAVFECPNCHTHTHIFGHDGAVKEANRQNLALLGSVPLLADIALAADAGQPVLAASSKKIAQVYSSIAEKVLCELKQAKLLRADN